MNNKLLFVILDLLIIYLGCNIFFKKKIKNIKYRLAVLFLLVIFTLVVVIFEKNVLNKYFVLSVVICLAMGNLYKGYKYSIYMVTVSIYGLFFILDYSIIHLFFFNADLEIFLSNEKNVFLSYMVTRLLCVLILFIVKSKKEQIILESRYIYKFMLINFLLISVFVSIIFPKKHPIIDSKYLMAFTIIVINLFLYFVLIDFIKISNKLKLKIISEERMKNELTLWQKLEEKNAIQRKIFHDYSNTLLCIRGLLEKEDSEKLKEYVESISVEYKLTKSYVETGNKLFDVLINTKYEKALSNEITMALKLDNLINLKIADGDFIVLIGNLVDNAMEACLRLKTRKKEIFFSIKNADKLEVVIRNPLEEKIEIIDNIIGSSKEEETHGIGLLNIKGIVQKYNGEQFIDTGEGYFTQYIMIK